ncbi:MAG: glycosyltransferase family 2 protein [Candidatus Shapirobacteria bacterium]
MKPIISVAIATFNEESNILRCLKAVHSWVDEIVIYDADSTDSTVKLARTFSKVKIISGPNHIMFHKNKQAAIDKCRGSWILQLDADEVVTPTLAREIQKITNKNFTKYSAFWINRRNFFLGRFLTKGGAYPDPTIRLYRRGKAYLPCLSVHEQVTVNGTIGHLTSVLDHYSDPTFTRYLERNNRYTSHIALDLQKAKIYPSFINFISYFIFKPIITFCLIYFRHKGYEDGFPGFVWAWYSSLRFPLAYTKLYETKNKHRP